MGKSCLYRRSGPKRGGEEHAAFELAELPKNCLFLRGVSMVESSTRHRGKDW